MSHADYILNTVNPNELISDAATRFIDMDNNAALKNAMLNLDINTLRKVVASNDHRIESGNPDISVAVVDTSVNTVDTDVNSKKEQMLAQLITSLLDLEEPQLTVGMNRHLCEGNQCRNLIGYISRIRNSDIENNNSVLFRTFDVSETEDMRRSYNVVSLFCDGKTEIISKLLSQRFHEIVSELFNCLRRDSHANLLHFRKLFLYLCECNPTELVHFIINHSQRTALDVELGTKNGQEGETGLLTDSETVSPMERLVLFSHSAPVAECIAELFECCEETLKSKLLCLLRDSRFLDTAAYRIADMSSLTLATAAVDGLVLFLNNAILLSKLPFSVFLESQSETSACVAVDFAYSMCEAFSNNSLTMDLRIECVESLRLFLGCCANSHCDGTAAEVMAPVMIPFITSTMLSISAISHKAFGELKLSAYKLSPRLSHLRLALSQLFCKLLWALQNDGDKRRKSLHDVLDMVSSSFWKTLTTFFFTYKNNSMFSTTFYRLFLLSLKSQHTLTQKNLLSKTKLVTQLVDAMGVEPDFVSRGHVILMLSALRLAELNATDRSQYLPVMLGSHAPWQTFVSALPSVQSDFFSNSVGIHQQDSIRCSTFLGPPPSPMPVPLEIIAPTPNVVREHEESFAKFVGFKEVPEGCSNDAIVSPTIEGTDKKKKRKKKKKSTGRDDTENRDSDNDNIEPANNDFLNEMTSEKLEALGPS